VCVFLCVCVSVTAFPHYCMDLNLTWRNGRRCPVAVHYWADLQSVHGFRCYDNIALNASAVYSLCACCLQLSTKLDLRVFALLEEWLWTVADVLGTGNVQLPSSIPWESVDGSKGCSPLGALSFLQGFDS